MPRQWQEVGFKPETKKAALSATINSLPPQRREKQQRQPGRKPAASGMCGRVQHPPFPNRENGEHSAAAAPAIPQFQDYCNSEGKQQAEWSRWHAGKDRQPKTHPQRGILWEEEFSPYTQCQSPLLPEWFFRPPTCGITQGWDMLKSEAYGKSVVSQLDR